MTTSKFQKPSTQAAQQTTAKDTTLPPPPQSTDKAIKGVKVSGSELAKNILGKSGAGISNGINSKLAESIFKSGPKDELQADDIYGKENADIINGFVDKLKGIGDRFGLGGSKSNIVSDLAKMVSFSGGKLKFDSKQLTDRLVAEMGGSSGLINGLSDAAKGSITSSYGISPEIYDKVKVMVGDTYSAYQSGNLDTARGVFDLMGRFCGDSDLFKVVDLGAQANLMAGLVNQAITLGVPDAIDRLLEKSRDSEVTRVAITANIETAVRQADLATLNSFATRLGNGAIRSQVPQAATIILSNYRIPRGTKESEYLTLWTELRSTLNRIDPQWLTVVRGSASITNLASFTRMSEDAKKIAVSDPTVRVAVMIAGQYPERNLMAQAGELYPVLVA